MNFIALILSLSTFGTILTVSPTALIGRDCGLYQDNYVLLGCYLAKENMIIVNNNFSEKWSEIIPHEFAHMYARKKKLYKETELYFGNREIMAEEYEQYFKNPQDYSVNQPIRYLFFKNYFPLF